ncbi:hypothetical protein BMF94_0126 [Rhodotorula taiwanensis]|uniref:Prefoldin subunit 6 n=1 Tax=Rhodotorula taiwanensis TaxID=741276 RepID=A0A2S5BJC5_9BASI|nr:hypothetical protein BMF94_0126 [Rhodotorula taiwanensis]
MSTPSSGAALEAKLQGATSSYAKLEADYARAVEARQLLDAQKTENEGVKKELAGLTEQNKVYKLVGPILMKQEQSEAKHNVDKRLEWINDEIRLLAGPFHALGSVQVQEGEACGGEAAKPLWKDSPIRSDMLILPPRTCKAKLKDVGGKLEEKKIEIVNLQGQYKQQLQAAGAATGPAVAAA